MNDETKKDDYYREEWAKIQVEKHNSQNKVLIGSLLFLAIIWTLNTCSR